MRTRTRRRLLALTGAIALAAIPTDAHARTDSKGRPFGRGTLQPSLGAGASFGGPLSVVSIGLGARYFVVNGLGPGLSVGDTILIYSDGLKADYPGIATQTPTNIVRVMPDLQWVFVRTRWFSPYVIGGVGPVFYNHGGGTAGQWMAGGGAFIGLGGPVFIDLGVNFNGVFPVQKCKDAFYYSGPTGQGQVVDACSFTWGPRLGLVIAFGVGNDDSSSRRRRRDRNEPDPEPPPEPERAWEPPPEPEPAPEPEPEPEPEAEPAWDPEPAPDVESPSEPEQAPDPDVAESEPPPDEPAPEGPEPPPDDGD